MKTLSTILLFILAVIATSCTTPERASERNVPIRARNSNEPMKRVFVLPFVDVENQKPKNVMDGARRTFITELLRTGEFVVLKNSDFPKDLETFKKGKENNYEYDLEKVSELAQGQGVSGVIEGQILEVKTKRVGDDVGIMRKIKAVVEAKVRIRAFAVDGKKEIFNEIRDATVEGTTTRFAERGYSNLDLNDDPALINEVVQKAFEQLVPPLTAVMRKLSWGGRIAMVRGEKIYINAGRISGIQVGDLLKVMDQGQDIFDPQTGTFLGRAEGRMKGTIEIVSYFGKDGAIGVIHSGADFRENDKVELY
jgi:TolB-like protein